MAPASIPLVKSIVRHISCAEAEEITQQAFQMATASEIEDLIFQFMEKKVGPDFQIL
jgi:signal transduction protein with GAF and PtsI domain